MEDSILVSIKKLLGIDEAYTPFDTDVIIHINTYLGVLNELGIGIEGFTVIDASQTWDEFLAGSKVSLNEAKTYLYLRVRQVFDPPESGALGAAIDKQIEELGWRMIIKNECSPS